MFGNRPRMTVQQTLKEEVALLEHLNQQRLGWDMLWEAAVKANDGKAEDEARAYMHSHLDQVLDSRIRILQLVKRAT